MRVHFCHKGTGAEEKERMEDFLVVEEVDGIESDLTRSVRKLASQLNRPSTQVKVCTCVYVTEILGVSTNVPFCSLREM